MKLTISNKLLIEGIPAGLFETFQSRLSFTNPKWEEAERMGRWTGNLDPVLKFYSPGPGHHSLIIPRGFIGHAIGLCRKYNEPFQIIDHRRVLPEIIFLFNGQLKPFQMEAVVALLKRDGGVIAAPTGSGKTVMALYMIAQRKQPALIIVHTKELLNQWIERIGTFLNIPANEIGIIGSGKKSIGPQITVALVQTLYKCAKDVAQHIGHVIVDECHRCPSRTFTEAVTAFDAKYLFGLSATPWRRDKLSKLIFWHLGDVRHKINQGDLQSSGDILKAELITRETVFQPFSDPTTEYSKMLSELTADVPRNLLIAGDVATESKNGGGVCLVLSDRKSHCSKLKEIFEGYGVHSEVLTGDTKTNARQDIVNRLNGGKIKVLIATGQLIGEGFDCKNLSTLFLATPISFSGRFLQYLGRVLRPAPGKDRAIVYDYVDVEDGPLIHSAKMRRRLLENFI